MRILPLLALNQAINAAEDIAADAGGRGVLLQLVVRGPAANATRQRWHALHDHFEGSAEVYVARVFCDENDANDDDDTCGALLGGRRAVYPVVLYGDCYEPEAYWGPRTLDALKALGESIRAPCSAWRPDRCDDASKAKLHGFEAMPARGLNELARTEAVARRARVEALEAALEEKRESLLEEWEALGTVRRTKAQRVSDHLRAMREVLSSRGVGWSSETRTSVSFEEESYAASEIADDYAYSLYNDEYDEYFDDAELGPYYDYEDEEYYSEYGGGYEDVDDVDESLYADYYDEYESSRR